MSKRGNEPAYAMPDTVYPNGQVQYGSGGLTVREAFIMAAMQGLLANSLFSYGAERLAKDSIEFADATLAAMEGKDGR